MENGEARIREKNIVQRCTVNIETASEIRAPAEPQCCTTQKVCTRRLQCELVLARRGSNVDLFINKWHANRDN